MPISNTGPIRVSDILTAKGFRWAPVPSFLPNLSDQGTRTPDPNQSFTKLFTQNRRVGPDDTQPHSLSEWRNVGNEVDLPLTPVCTRNGSNVRVTWTNATPGAYTAILLMRVPTIDNSSPVIIPEEYVVAATETASIGATSVEFPMTFGTNYTYRALVSHYWSNTFFDAGSGFQSAYVLADGAVQNNVIVSGGDGAHPFGLSIYTAGQVSGRYYGFVAPGTSYDVANVLTVYTNTALDTSGDWSLGGPPDWTGTQLYGTDSGPTLPRFEAIGAGEGEYVRVLNGVFAYSLRISSWYGTIIDGPTFVA